MTLLANSLLSTLFFQVNQEKPTVFPDESAWFLQNDFQPLDGLSVGDERPWHARGFRVRQDMTQSTMQNGSRILRAGGALLQKIDGEVWAIQPSLFINRFSRCFSDGTEIVLLSVNRHQQMLALAQANTQVGNQNNEVLGLAKWKPIFNRKKFNSKNIALWNYEIKAHIDELVADTFKNKIPR